MYSYHTHALLLQHTLLLLLLLVGWDEILEGGLAEGATVMSWRVSDGMYRGECIV